MNEVLQPWLKRTGWVLLVLFAMEAFLRIAVRNQHVGFTYDAEWGTRKVPGSTVFWGTEGFGLTRYSGVGEIETPDSGGDNVVVFGDSHTEALQTGSDLNFVSVAERYLRAKGIYADLRNLGDSGLDVPDYIYRIPLVRKSFSPKAMVIQLTTGDFDGQNPDSPNRLVSDDAGHLSLVHDAPRNLNTSSWRLKSAISLLDYGSQRFKEIFLRKANPESDSLDGQTLEESAWRLRVRGQLVALKQALEDLPTTIVLLPYEPMYSGHGIAKASRHYEILLEETRAVGTWRVLDPSREFQNLLQQGQFPRGFSNCAPPGTGHLNVAGHEKVGRLLADILAEILR